MNVKFYLATLITLLILGTNTSKAQFINYEDDNGWNLGMNMGATWQEAENNLVSKGGFAGGFTFGKSIYEKEGALLALDWRFRYLAGKAYGWETTRTYGQEFQHHAGGFGFRNYKFSLNEFTLEGVLTLNRLRERTGILLYGFGGVGFTAYGVKSNNGSFVFNHDYTLIDTTGTPDQIQDALHDLEWRQNLDREYEEIAQYNSGPEFKFMPSLGVGIGYQFTEHFSLGLEHKITYALNDFIDGTLDGNNDRYHYTAAYMRFNLYGGGGRTTYTVPSGGGGGGGGYIPPPTNTTPPVSTSVACDKPLVSFTAPDRNNAQVNQAGYNVTANIYYLTNRNQITFKHNGYEVTNFNFDPNSNKFSASVILNEGSNKFEIIAKNDCDTDKDSKTIIYKKPVVVGPKPIINYSNPPSTPHNSSSQNFNIQAEILNIISANQISFTVNGQQSTNFTFNANTHQFQSPIVLNTGANNVNITATNSEGMDSESVIINYKPVTGPPPVVNITNPSGNPHYATVKPININATIENVTSASQIQVLYNGANFPTFTFDKNTGKLHFSNLLNVGDNTVSITATNAYGSDNDAVKINYKPSEVVTKPPVVDFIDPSAKISTSSTQNRHIKVKLLNVDSKQNVFITFNGMNQTNFSFNTVTKIAEFDVNLLVGSNKLYAKGTNIAGSDDDKITINYEERPCPKPEIAITQPMKNPYTTSNSKGVIKAKIQNAKSVKFMVNGQPSPGFTFNAASGDFTSLLNLRTGTYSYRIIAINPCGESVKDLTITYKADDPCDAPVLRITRPQGNTYSQTTPQAKISVNAANISKKDEIKVTQNGRAIPFEFNTNTRTVSISSKAAIGDNKFRITGTNPCGTDTQEVTIIREDPCDPPVVSRVRPESGTVKTQQDWTSCMFKVENVTSKNEIKVLVNGVANDFTYDTNSKLVKFKAPISAPTTTVVVTATLPCGSDSKEVVYTKETAPCDEPVIQIKAPKTNPMTTAADKINFAVVVQNITGQNDVTVTANGASINTTYIASSNMLKFAVPVNKDVVKVNITAKNNCGTVTETQVINQEQKPAPEVDISAPAKSPYNTSESKYNVKGKVLNVSGKSEITVLVNGAATSNYSYSTANYSISVPVTLNTGDNKITITGTNAQGSDTETVIINRSCNEPSISFTNISNSTTASAPHEVKVRNWTVKGKVTNPNDVTLTMSIEGVNFTNFLFNQSTGIFSANLTFNAVDHRINLTVKANSPCGNDSKIGRMIFKGISSPTGGQSSGTSTEGTNLGGGNSGGDTGSGGHSQSGVNMQAYDIHIKKADMYFNAKQYTTAKTYYKKAQNVNPSAAYPKEQIAKIDLIIKNSKTNPTKPSGSSSKPSGSSTKPAVTKPSSTKPSSSGSSRPSSSSSSGSSKSSTSTKPSSGSSRSSETVKPAASSGSSKSSSGSSKTTSGSSKTSTSGSSKTTTTKPSSGTTKGGVSSRNGG